MQCSCWFTPGQDSCVSIIHILCTKDGHIFIGNRCRLSSGEWVPEVPIVSWSLPQRHPMSTPTHLEPSRDEQTNHRLATHCPPAVGRRPRPPPPWSTPGDTALTGWCGTHTAGCRAYPAWPAILPSPVTAKSAEATRGQCRRRSRLPQPRSQRGPRPCAGRPLALPALPLALSLPRSHRSWPPAGAKNAPRSGTATPASVGGGTRRRWPRHGVTATGGGGAPRGTAPNGGRQ